MNIVTGTYLFLGIGIGMNIGIWLAIFVIKKVYDPYIKELKGYIDYWYNQYMIEIKK